MSISRKLLLSCSLAAVYSSATYGYFLDGNGYFGMKGETRVSPDFQKNRGTYQASELSFDLTGEVRANDRASFNLRLGIFEDPNAAYLGDNAKPGQCASDSSDAESNTESNCEGRHQSTTNSGYSDYKPVIREAYAKYAFNYCLLTAGRRSRDVGLGLLHSSAKNPFEQEASTFDGFTCDVNTQKQQDLGFYFGFDKLQETGTGISDTFATRTKNSSANADRYGANSPGDDMDQFFFGLTLDDLKSKGQGASFAKQVSIYFSNILGSSSKTDVKYLDLYTGLYFGKFVFKNELVFRMGKSAEPNLVLNGGKYQDEDNNPAVNNIQSIGLAGEFEYTWSRSGAAIGPTEFNEGNSKRHVSFLTYAYAPGDADGYYEDRSNLSKEVDKEIGLSNRNTNNKAMAFHRNYKPALLMFNGKGTSRYLNKGGVFNSQRVMNASVYSLGYRYESIESGNFEVKMITGRLLESMPSEVKSYYEAHPDPNKNRPVGYGGNNLGYELDLLYTWQYRREVEVGAGIAGATAGNAFDVSSDQSPSTQFGLLGSFALRF